LGGGEVGPRKQVIMGMTIKNTIRDNNQRYCLNVDFGEKSCRDIKAKDLMLPLNISNYFHYYLQELRPILSKDKKIIALWINKKGEADSTSAMSYHLIKAQKILKLKTKLKSQNIRITQSTLAKKKSLSMDPDEGKNYLRSVTTRQGHTEAVLEKHYVRPHQKEPIRLDQLKEMEKTEKMIIEDKDKKRKRTDDKSKKLTKKKKIEKFTCRFPGCGIICSNQFAILRHEKVK
jgi:hypothetical protein